MAAANFSFSSKYREFREWRGFHLQGTVMLCTSQRLFSWDCQRSPSRWIISYSIIEEPEARGGELVKPPLELPRWPWSPVKGLWLFSTINKYMHSGAWESKDQGWPGETVINFSLAGERKWENSVAKYIFANMKVPMTQASRLSSAPGSGRTWP